MAQPFDAEKLQLTGEAVPLAEPVQLQLGTGRAVFSVSENGVLAYQRGAARGGMQLLWLDRSGKQLGAVGEPDFYSQFQLSPDGQKVAVAISDPQSGGSDIWLYELSRGSRTRFTFGPAFQVAPLWSPDGGRIVFRSDRKGLFDFYQKAASGASREEILFASDEHKIPTSWSADGRLIAYTNTGQANGKGQIWILPLEGEHQPFPFLQTPADEGLAQFSPDGRWLAYVSNELGNNQVFIALFPGPGGKWRVSTGGGTEPRWRGDGKELFFRAPEHKLMAVGVQAQGSTLELGQAQPLFAAPSPTTPGFHYDVTRDGQRFLIVTAGEVGSAPLTLVVNWTADLKKN